MLKARKLKSGNWNVRVTVCGQSYSFTHPNRKTAIRLAAAFAEEVKENIANPPLIDAIARYIDKGSETLSPATVRGYRSIERTLRKKHPALCQKRIVALTDSDISLPGSRRRSSRPLIWKSSGSCRSSRTRSSRFQSCSEPSAAYAAVRSAPSLCRILTETM